MMAATSIKVRVPLGVDAVGQAGLDSDGRGSVQHSRQT
jgi:hypothetical protein